MYSVVTSPVRCFLAKVFRSDSGNIIFYPLFTVRIRIARVYSRGIHIP